MEDVNAPPAGDAAAAASPKADADKMETDEPKNSAEPPKKVKIVRHDLKVDSFTTGADTATLNAYFEREVAMATQDRMIFETNQARNDLESYVLDMKSRLNGDLATYIKESDKEAFIGKLNGEEDWLYNDGFDSQKSEYRKRIQELKLTGDAIIHRFDEHHNRDTHVATLKSAIGHYSQLANSTDEKYAHITAEERKKVLDECNAADQWLAAALSAQDKLTPADTPSVTTLQLTQKKTALEQVVSPIMHKPKPKPVEEKKPEEKKPEPAAAAAAGDAKPEAEKPASEDTSKPMEQ